MKLHSLLLFCLLTPASLLAQANLPYSQRAAKLQKEIWGTTVPEFKATNVPANLSKESAVILARSYNSQRVSGGKAKFSGMATYTEKTVILHERVKINDKVALEQFSTLEYQKQLDKSVSYFLNTEKDLQNTFIGVKVIKPGGKENVLNTGEEVLVKNDIKDQKGKLAISDLQVGDILDYYISVFSFSEKEENQLYKDHDDILMFVDEYPVLFYSVDYKFSKGVNVKYIYANNAPHFEENYDPAGNLSLNLKTTNLARYQSQLWTSPLRQYPYIEIASSYVMGYMNLFTGAKKADRVTSMYDRSLGGFENLFVELGYKDFDEPEKKLKDYFKTGKALKNAPLDSTMKILYDEWKFKVFCSYQGDELEQLNKMNYRTANNKVAAAVMGMMLTDMNINYDILIVSSRNGSSLENIYNTNDFDAIIRINGPQPMYMSFDDVTTHFNEIPARFQGEKANVLHAKRRNASMPYNFTPVGEDILPVIQSDNNSAAYEVQVSLLSANTQKLKIDRIVSESGSMRHNDQKQLIPVQDIDNACMELVNGDPLAKRLSRLKETKKMLDDYASSFNKEREEMIKNFSSEIKADYDQEPQQLTNYKILNNALENSSPVFKFSSSFLLDNLVKKAGNNYIVDVGKLTGSFLKLDNKDENRNVDIYMPSARSFKYTINFTIPQGYIAKGVEELNIVKSNKTGSFSSSAFIKGNTLSITVNRVYANNFEKASDWTLLKDVIKTASSFNDQKILLEKQ